MDQKDAARPYGSKMSQRRMKSPPSKANRTKGGERESGVEGDIW